MAKTTRATKAAKRTTPAPAKRAGTSDERVHKDLYKAIIDHRIAPGTPLQEDALAQAFGISRTLIRKALQRLAHERLVELVPNKGAFVAKPSAEEARHVFEARRQPGRVSGRQPLLRLRAGAGAARSGGA